jgi:hypothetical protein
LLFFSLTDFDTLCLFGWHLSLPVFSSILSG